MSRSSNKFWRRTDGNVLIEFALFLPFLLLILAGTIELGRAHFQSIAIEKGIRSGALYLARTDDPLASGSQSSASNLAMTGTLDGTGSYLVPGWASGNLDIATATFNMDLQNIPVIKLTAAVPYQPLMPGLMNFLGMDNYTMSFSHEQAFIGR